MHASSSNRVRKVATFLCIHHGLCVVTFDTPRAGVFFGGGYTALQVGSHLSSDIRGLRGSAQGGGGGGRGR